MMEKIIVEIYPHEYPMSNKTRMPEELFGELSTLATKSFFVIKMIEGPGSNYEPPRTLRLIDCLVLRL